MSLNQEIANSFKDEIDYPLPNVEINQYFSICDEISSSINQFIAIIKNDRINHTQNDNNSIK